MDNVELIPFLKKEELCEEYKRAEVLLLPSRQECWGLVVNEAASFGLPIVSTRGSGAAVEFLYGTDYQEYLAERDNVISLYLCLKKCLTSSNRKEYGCYLMQKSKYYSIEKNVEVYLSSINEIYSSGHIP